MSVGVKRASAKVAEQDKQILKAKMPDRPWVVIPILSDKKFQYAAVEQHNDGEVRFVVGQSTWSQSIVGVLMSIVSDSATSIAAKAEGKVFYFDKKKFGYYHRADGTVLIMGQVSWFKKKKGFPVTFLPGVA